MESLSQNRIRVAYLIKMKSEENKLKRDFKYNKKEYMFMKTMKKHLTTKVLSILLGLLMVTALTNLLPVSAANPGVNVITVNGNQELNNVYKYLVNGVRSETGTLGSGGCTASFDSTTGTLTLQDYNGSVVYAIIDGTNDLNIKLIGSNTITESATDSVGIYNQEGDINITAEDTASLTVNVTSTAYTAYGIATGSAAGHSNGNVTIGGKANVTVNATVTAPALEYRQVWGIYAIQAVSINDQASYTAVCKTTSPGTNNAKGIYAEGGTTINTTGDINIDCSDNIGYTYAIYGSKSTLTRVGTMTLKWQGNSGGPVAPSTSFDGAENIVAKIDTTNWIAVYRYGTVRALTITKGSNERGRYTDTYLAGDTATITANLPDTYYIFKEWTGTEGLTFLDSTSKTSSTAKFTIPAGDTAVTATYEQTLFSVQPQSKTGAVDSNIEFNWTVAPESVVNFVNVQVKNGEAWDTDWTMTDEYKTAGAHTYSKYSSVAGSKTYRLAYYIGSYYYSDEFTLTWTDGPAAITAVTVSPATTNVQKGSTQAFTANVTGTGAYDNSVVWSVSGGITGTTINSSSGVLSIDTGETASTLTVTATSVGDSTKSGSATVTVQEPEALTGTVNISGTIQFGENLTASVGSDNNTGTLTYTWYRDAIIISTGATYSIVAADIGQTIECRVTSSVQTGNISKTTSAISKAVGPSAPTGLLGVSPTTIGGTDGKITGTTTLMEYSTTTSFDTSTDCTDTEITGLSVGTYYVRLKETATHNASANTTVTVQEPEALTGTVTISGTTKFGENLTASVSGGNNTGTLTYKWYRGATEIGTGTTYTITVTDIDSTLKCEVESSVQTGKISTTTGVIEKADGPSAPTGLLGVKPSALGGTDGKITGTTTLMEYSTTTSFGTSTDCTGTEITGLSAGTYYVRLKETTTHFASAYATVIVPEEGAFSGIVTISGTEKFGETLTASISGDNNTGTLTYTWYRGASLVGTGVTYSIVTDDIGVTLECRVTSSVQTGYISKTTSAITKAVGPTAPTGLLGVKPTTVGRTDGKITGTTTLMEYSTTTSFDTSTGCTGTEITDLSTGTYYVRLKETTMYLASAYATVTVPVAESKSTACDITSFNIGGVSGVITGTNITITLPSGTDVTASIPTIAISSNATIDKTTAQNFTAPVTYRVTAEDATTYKDYTVTVSIATVPSTPTPIITPASPTQSSSLTITNGAGGTHQPNSDGALTMTCSGDLEDFADIYVDGVLVGAENYTLESGSTIVTLKEEYLNELPVGTHILTFLYWTGSAETTFAIIDGKDAVPKTGENMQVLWLLALMLGSGVGAIYIGRKKKFSRN